MSKNTLRIDMNIMSSDNGPSRASVGETFPDDAIRVIVAAKPNSCKTLLLRILTDALKNAGIADSNIEIDCDDQEHASWKLANEKEMISHLKTRKIVLHEVHLYRPIDLDLLSMERFKNTVDTMSEEWLESGGNITCEFSTNASSLVKKIDYLFTKKAAGVTWKLHRCEICERHSNGATPYHVEIEE